MNEQIWNIITGNVGFMDRTDQYPDTYIRPIVNRLMQAACSLLVLCLHGKNIRIHYYSGDLIYIRYGNFKYKVADVFTTDNQLVLNGIFMSD